MNETGINCDKCAKYLTWGDSAGVSAKLCYPCRSIWIDEKTEITPMMIQQQLLRSDHIQVARDEHDSTDSFCTPPWLLEIVYDVFCDVPDTDPCSNPHSMVRSRESFTIEDDGLSQKWGRNVFGNNPYSKPMPWLKRFADHYGAVIALPKLDTSTEWWQRYASRAVAMCLLKKRVSFYRGGELQGAAMFPSVVLLMGHDAELLKSRFKAKFGPHGDIWARN